MEPLLSVENLEVQFPVRRGFLAKTSGYVRAVDGVSLTLNRGETLGIVGESGCGKTTTGLAILRLVEPTGGRLVFQGREFSGLPRSELRPLRKDMQIIFQDPYASLNPRMTVRRILGDPMKLHRICAPRERSERIAYLLDRVGLSAEQAGRYPHEFSGGQRQRIGIARALCLNPKIVIGDEPVSALDVSIQAQIINLLIDLQKEFKLSYIIISHDLAVVEYICDRIAVMYVGKLVEIASYRDLYGDPKHPYTQALLSAIPSTDPRVVRERIILTGDVPSPITPPSGCRFHPRCPSRKEECAHEEPALRDLGGNRFVSCHLYS